MTKVPRHLRLTRPVVRSYLSPRGHRECPTNGEDEQGVRPHRTAGEQEVC